MLLLLFAVGEGSYAIDISLVEEVVPMMKLRDIPNTPDYVSGLFNYRGDFVPVIDLCQLMIGRGSKESLSTRIVIIDFIVDKDKKVYLGLMAESVTTTIDEADVSFTEASISVEDSQYLGEVGAHNKDIIQKIDINKLLPDFLKRVLFFDEG